MRFLTAFIICLAFNAPIFSQLVVEQGMTVEDYVSNVLIGNGVTATNITYTGGMDQLGYLYGAEGMFSVESGLVLSCDNAVNLDCNNPGACSDCLGYDQTDQDLLDVANSVPPLIGQSFTVSSVNDICILEFDFEAAGDSIAFNYVFGSDEYLTYVNTQYNDIFAFFLSGPGITGPYAAPAGFPDGAINIAQVPDSDPLLPITISSVNNVTNTEYYIDNPSNEGICINGYTETFTASASVQCGEIYHIKLAIADGADTALESFVLLEEGSFSSNAVELIADASLEGADIFLGDTTVVEGCNDAIFTVVRPDDSELDTIFLNVYGTASMGSDFSSVFTEVVMEPGQSSADVVLGVINDNVNEDPEWVTVEYEYINGCGDTILSSATIVILDPEPINLLTSPVGCLEADGSILLDVTPTSGFGPYTYSWDTAPEDTLNSFTYNTGFIPGTATVTVTDVCNSITEAEINWEILEDFIGEDDLVCLGLSETVPTTGGTGGYSEINTEIEDSNGDMVWVSLIGASLDTVLISFNDDANVQTGLYSGLYNTGSGGIGSIEVQLIDGCGNITYSTISVQVCELEFPNIFTPNSDGDNEQFEIQGLQGYPGAQLTVFDRWGTQVFYDSNYKGAWRGKSNDSQDLADGIYFFQLTLNYNDPEPIQYTGDVYVDESVSGQVTFSGSVHIAR